MFGALLLCIVPALVGTMVLVGWAILALWPVAGEPSEESTTYEAWTTVLRALRQPSVRKAGYPAVRRIRLAWASHSPRTMAHMATHSPTRAWVWHTGPPM